jgi:cytochrome c oxidase assembly protein subunit 15
MSMTDLTRTNAWPHRMAVLMVCATFPLIWLGGLVTTYDAGMAVPDWPSTYGRNLFLYPWQTWLAAPWDLFIEHGHRLLASLVGFIAIATVVVTWRFESRPWVRWVAFGGLALVIFQGVLGGVRVLLDDRQIAQIHGIVGPTFFAYAVCLAAVTSRWWQAVDQAGGGLSRHVVTAAWWVAGLALFQLVCGSQVRHVTGMTSHALFGLAIQIHLGVAAILMVAAPYLSIAVARDPAARKRLMMPGVVLSALIVLQVLLGAATWFAKYGTPAALVSLLPISTVTLEAKGMGASILATAHVANGALVLAVSTWIAIRSSRYAAKRFTTQSGSALSGVAA